MTPANYDIMLQRAGLLEESLLGVFRRHRLSWHVARVGARLEFGFSAQPPRNGTESAARMRPLLERAIHLALLNRGVLLTPFHNMMLCSPATTAEHLERLTDALDASLLQLAAALR